MYRALLGDEPVPPGLALVRGGVLRDTRVEMPPLVLPHLLVDPHPGPGEPERGAAATEGPVPLPGGTDVVAAPPLVTRAPGIPLPPVDNAAPALARAEDGVGDA